MIDTDKRISQIFYIVILSFMGVIIGISVVCAIFGMTFEDFIHLVSPSCIIRDYYGFYCPGCGGVRAFLYFIHGDVLNSIYYNPFLLYAVIIFFIRYTLSLLTKEKVKPFIIKPLHFYVAVGILLGQWLIKNICLLCFSTPLIPF